MSKVMIGSAIGGVLAAVLAASVLGGGREQSPGDPFLAGRPADGRAQPLEEDLDSRIDGNQPLFGFEEAIARNHLVVVGTVTADLGEREYARLSLKSGGDQSAGEQTPGVRTRLREVRIERVVKGVPSSSQDTIVVEELSNTPTARVGGRYLFLLAPWHPGTYQAGAYGAITQSQAGLQFAGGELAGDTLPQLSSLDLAQATELVTRTVDRQSVERVGRLAVPQPAPGRPYDIAHAYSLGAAASIEVDGMQVAGARVRAAAAAAGAGIASMPPPPSSEEPPLTIVTVRYVSGQTASFQVDLARGQFVSKSGGVTVPLPASLRELLSAAR